MSRNWLANNFWLKILSLALAIIAWFYFSSELATKINLF